MKKSIVLTSLIFLVNSTALFAQNQTFDADVSQSKLAWTGKKIGGKHNGLVKIKSGFISFKDGKPEAGKFEIDLTTISCSDLTDPAKNADLVNHLKSDDFFSVEKYPISTLTITKFSPIEKAPKGQPNYKVFGNLNIKGKNNPIEFPAYIDVKGKTLTGKADFSIDRTKWDITYKSGTIFPSLADKAIADNIDFSVFIKATSK
ncbi:MAG: YceI family protein [Chitinophagales bacterium]|nr:YceI family protein [Chitinophagales bacterium]MDW8273711.1 YceI family protein [Chitinophagales bacterium]